MDTTYNGHNLRECEICRAPTTERGNGRANLCRAHDPEAQLGAKVVEILDWEAPAYGDCPGTLSLRRVWNETTAAARSLGLFDEKGGAS